MNQDNNFNQNSFNFQGSNGMSNNLPLNNQNMNVNQQIAPSYAQSIMQEPTSQPTNAFESSNANNLNFNNKPTKKINLGLIIGIVAVVAVVGVGIVFGSKFFSNGGNNNTDNNSNAVNSIKNGTAKLVYTSKNRIEQIENENAYKYFTTKDEEGNTIVLDNSGDVIFKTKVGYEYLDNKYMLFYENKDGKSITNVFDLKKKKVIFTYESISYLHSANYHLYKDGILYYEKQEYGQLNLIAYDLANNKKLWEFNSDKVMFEPFVSRIMGNYILLGTRNYNSILDHKSELHASSVMDLNGNLVLEGNTDEYKYYNFEKENLVHTFIMNDKYYLKVKFEQYVEVYDFSHNLISKISLEPKDGISYQLNAIFEEGLFAVSEYNSSYLGKYVLYDVNKNIVLESESVIRYASNVSRSTIPSDVVVLDGRKKYLIKDSKLIETFDDYQSDEKLFLLMEYNDTVNSKYTEKFINLKTLEKFDNPLGNIQYGFKESLNGEYVILSKIDTWYVYDSKFNLKYESNNPLEPINDKYVFEYMLEGNKIFVVNIENGKKNEVEIKGEFKYELSSGGFVTSDGTNYYLYGFN